MISYKEVCALFRYDAKTGHLYWRESGKGRDPSLLAGYPSRGYICVRIRGRSYLAHRLIWFLKTGRWPKKHIDHKNGVRSDNRWKNIRLATRSQNMRNAAIRSNNTSGYKGVIWHRECKAWAALISVNGKRLWLGAHSTPRKAHAAYVAAAKKHFGEFARAR